MKQTAVEWLENEFQEMCKDFGGVHSDFIVKFDQAKAKERSQKAEEYLKGFKDGKEYQIKLDELTFKSENIVMFMTPENGEIESIILTDNPDCGVKGITFKSE